MANAGAMKRAFDLLERARLAPTRTTRNRASEPFLNRASQVRVLPGAQTRVQVLAAMVTEVGGGVVEPKRCSVAELLAAWLEHIEHVGRSRSTLVG